MKHLKNTKSILLLMLILLASAFAGIAFDSYFPPGMVMASAPLFVNLEKTSGCNMAGISTVIYIIPLADIVSFPSINKSGNPENFVKFIGDFVLAENKYWHTIYSEKEMGDLVNESDGSVGAKFFRQKATAFHPKNSEQAVGMAAILNNTNVCVIIKELSSGKMRVVGNKEIPATVSSNENIGKAYGDEKGITFNFEAANCTPAPFYYGSVVTENEVLFSPERMTADAESINFAVSSRWVVGANTMAITLTTLENMVPGDVVRIEYDASSTGSLAFTGEFGASAILDAENEWFEVTKLDAGSFAITNGNFS